MREAASTERSRFDPGRLARALWHGRTLRAQLLILFVLIELVAAAVAGAVTILNARTATRVEIAASMELAELWVNEAVQLAQREAPAERLAERSWLPCPPSSSTCATCGSRSGTRPGS